MTIAIIAILWLSFLVGFIGGAWFARHVTEANTCPICNERLQGHIDEHA